MDQHPHTIVTAALGYPYIKATHFIESEDAPSSRRYRRSKNVSRSEKMVSAAGKPEANPRFRGGVWWARKMPSMELPHIDIVT